MKNDQSGQPNFKAPAAPAENLADDQKQTIRNIQDAIQKDPGQRKVVPLGSNPQDKYAVRGPES
jgi:hypothetical protein